MAKTKKDEALKGGGFLTTEEIEKNKAETDKRSSNKPQAIPGAYKGSRVTEIEVTKSKAGHPQIIVHTTLSDKYRELVQYFTFGPEAKNIRISKDQFLGFFYSAFGHVFSPIESDNLAEGIAEAVNQVKQYVDKPYTQVIKHQQTFYGKMDAETGKVEIKEGWDAKPWFAVQDGKEVTFNEANAVKYLNEKDAIALKEKILKNSIPAEGKEVKDEDIPEHMRETEDHPL